MAIHTRIKTEAPLSPCCCPCWESFPAHGNANADAVGDRRRAQLATVRRIVVIPPFFGTETLAKADAQALPNRKRISPMRRQMRRLTKNCSKYAEQPSGKPGEAMQKRTQLPERVRHGRRLRSSLRTNLGGCLQRAETDTGTAL